MLLMHDFDVIRKPLNISGTEPFDTSTGPASE
jgi:hypothetical protein